MINPNDYDNHSFQEGALKRFFYWIDERHMIYLKYKLNKEPWPWTNDPILQEFKFTNPLRENDTGTIWLRENIREPHKNDSELFFNIATYRQFNWWPTGVALDYIYEWDPEKYEKILRDQKAKVKKIFTGAHMTTGTLKGNDKIEQYVWHVLDPLWNNRDEYKPDAGDTLQAAFKRIRKAIGFGSFISFEVVTDLRHTRFLRDAPDIMTWANPGPGAMRGINRILGFPVGRVTPEERAVSRNQKNDYHPVRMFNDDHYIELMRKLLELSPSYVNDHVPALEMRDIEHSLCEYDKYERVRCKQGKVRSKFIPPHERN